MLSRERVNKGTKRMNSLRLPPHFYLTQIYWENHCLQILRNPVALNSYLGLSALSSARSSSPPSPTHAFLTQQNFTNPSPCSQFFCVYEVAQSPHENNMSGANTKSVLARFRDNNWENGRDFVKTFYVKNLMWEREGSLSARWMTCLGFR